MVQIGKRIRRLLLFRYLDYRTQWIYFRQKRLGVFLIALGLNLLLSPLEIQAHVKKRKFHKKKTEESSFSLNPNSESLNENKDIAKVQSISAQKLGWSLTQESNQQFIFQNKSDSYSFKMNLNDPKLLGVLQKSNQKQEGAQDPVFIVSAKPCQSCPEDQAIYLITPKKKEKELRRVIYPGKIFEPDAGVLLYESRVFFGECLSEAKPVLVVFQKDKVDRRKFPQGSVLIAELDFNSVEILKETMVESRFPPIAKTLSLVKLGKCQEISTRNRKMPPMWIRIHPENIPEAQEPADANAAGGRTEQI